MIEFLNSQKDFKVEVVDTTKACKEIGSSKCVNVLLLSTSCKFNLFSKEELEKALEKLVKKEFLELNKRALNYF